MGKMLKNKIDEEIISYIKGIKKLNLIQVCELNLKQFKELLKQIGSRTYLIEEMRLNQKRELLELISMEENQLRFLIKNNIKTKSDWIKYTLKK